MRNKTRMILTPVFIAFLVLVLTISFSSNLLSKAKHDIDFIFAGNQKSGSAKSVACYLINGKTPVKLSKNYSSNAFSISISGDNIYIAGYEVINGKRIAKYWKNGIGVSLSDSMTHSYATGIYADYHDTYVCGNQKNEKDIYIAKFWKNGIPVLLTDGSREAIATSIFISDSSVYVAGYELSLNNVYQAKYWKNGKAIILSNETNESIANSIFVSDDHVYVTGYIKNSDNIPVAIYWKENIPIKLTANESESKSIYVFGKDVYVAGYEKANNGISVARFWKNGIPTDISNGMNDAKASYIQVKKGNVYVLFSEQDQNGISKEKLWTKERIYQLNDETNHFYFNTFAVGRNLQ